MSTGWADRRRDAGEEHRKKYSTAALEGFTCERCKKRIRGQIYYSDGRGAWCIDCYRKRARGR